MPFEIDEFTSTDEDAPAEAPLWPDLPLPLLSSLSGDVAALGLSIGISHRTMSSFRKPGTREDHRRGNRLWETLTAPLTVDWEPCLAMWRERITREDEEEEDEEQEEDESLPGEWWKKWLGWFL